MIIYAYIASDRRITWSFKMNIKNYQRRSQPYASSKHCFILSAQRCNKEEQQIQNLASNKPPEPQFTLKQSPPFASSSAASKSPSKTPQRTLQLNLQRWTTTKGRSQRERATRDERSPNPNPNWSSMAIHMEDFMTSGRLGCLQVPARDWKEGGRKGGRKEWMNVCVDV